MLALLGVAAMTLQLAMPVNPLDNPSAGEREAIEAAVIQQEHDRARSASQSRPCRCRVPWIDDETCVLCGREAMA